MLEKLLELGSEKDIMGSLLKIAFGKQLDANAYKDIKHIRTNEARAGTTRLFIAQGRNTGIHGPRELVNWLQDETNVPQSVMDDVVIRDDFSFITCPDAEAQTILDVFMARPGRSLVSVSKEKART